MKTITTLSLVAIIAAFAICLLACGCDQAPSTIQPDASHDSALVSTWSVDDGQAGSWALSFEADGSCSYDNQGSPSACTWTTADSAVTMVFSTFTVTAPYVVDGDVRATG